MLPPKAFQAGIAEIYLRFPKMDPPDKERAKAWYIKLKDEAEDIFRLSCTKVSDYERFPENPVQAILKEIKILRGDDIQAQKAYMALAERAHDLCGVGMSRETCLTAIKESLAAGPYKEVVPFVDTFAFEIWSESNPSATRAQFINAWNARIFDVNKDRKQLRTGETKGIEDSLHGILENAEETIKARKEAMEPEDDPDGAL